MVSTATAMMITAPSISRCQIGSICSRLNPLLRKARKNAAVVVRQIAPCPPIDVPPTITAVSTAKTKLKSSRAGRIERRVQHPGQRRSRKQQEDHGLHPVDGDTGQTRGFHIAAHGETLRPKRVRLSRMVAMITTAIAIHVAEVSPARARDQPIGVGLAASRRRIEACRRT